jgi:hypothetical protein
MLNDAIFEVNDCNDARELMCIAIRISPNLDEVDRVKFTHACIERLEMITIF